MSTTKTATPRTDDPMFDKDLRAFLGDCYEDETVEPQAVKKAPKAAKPQPQKKEPARTSEPVAAAWEPVPVSEWDWKDRLITAVKGMLPYSALSLICFYWQQTGLMDSKAAIPSFCFCCLMVGLNFGRAMR